MPGLLDLPSELLFEIIGLVACTSNLLPPDGKRHRPEQLYSRNIVCVPTSHPSWLYPTRSLLLSCRRLSSETSIYHTKMPQVLKLDVAVVDNHWIWPCWRYIPGELDFVLERLDVNLMYCCTQEERAAYSSVTPRCTYQEEFVRTINHLLRSGPPSLLLRSTSNHPNFRIKTVTVNMNNASIKGGNEPLSEEIVPCRQIDGLRHLTFDSLYPVDLPSCLRHIDMLAVFMETLIHDIHVGLMIRERVDRVHFCVDTRVRKVIDIAEYLSKKDEKIVAEYKQRSGA
jgi:hypothetical protein